MEQEKLKVEINLKFENEDFNGIGTNSYFFIDNNIYNGSMFYNFIFGKNTDEKILRSGIWQYAKVKINDVELFVPFNQMIEDRTKSCLFNAYDGERMFVMTNEEAILIATCFFISHILFAVETNGRCKYYVEHYGLDKLELLFTTLKYQIYDIEHLNESAYRLLD